MKYSIIGEQELVIAFSLIGVDGHIANSREEALIAFQSVTGAGNVLAGNTPTTEESVMVLILTDQVANFLDEEVQEWQIKGDYPLIVEIPSLQSPLGERKSLSASIREAIGIKV